MVQSNKSLYRWIDYMKWQHILARKGSIHFSKWCSSSFCGCWAQVFRLAIWTEIAANYFYDTKIFETKHESSKLRLTFFWKNAHESPTLYFVFFYSRVSVRDHITLKALLWYLENRDEKQKSMTQIFLDFRKGSQVGELNQWCGKISARRGRFTQNNASLQILCDCWFAPSPTDQNLQY